MKRTLRLLCCFVSAVALSAVTALHAQIIVTVAGGGTGLGDGGQATAGTLHYPTCVAVDASGNMYIADEGNNRVRKVNSSGVISTIAGTGVSGLGADNIPATNSALYAPNGVAYDAAGNVYIAEQGGSVVRKVTTTGYIYTIAGTGSSGFTTDGIATAQELNQPTNVAVDPTGNVYVADWNNNRVRVITPSGYMYTVAGGGSATGYGGPATAALLHSPYSVSLDGYGGLYVSDENGQRLVKINLATDVINAVGGTYLTAGFTGVGGPATAAEYYYPDGIVADAGALYVADYNNNVIREINIASDKDSIAVGNHTAGFTGDGYAATAAELWGPAGVAVDVYGNVYIADYNNNRIRKVASGNHPPHFVNGEIQSLSICENSVGDSINSLLEVNDTDVGQIETWTMLLAPVHGVARVGYTATSTGGILTPVGLYYTPYPGYSGNDSFRVQVNDGISVDSTMIHVSIQSFFAGHITPEPAIVCPGNTVTLSADTAGGTWSSSNSSIATVSSGGLVSGISAGNVFISYTISNSCGTTSAAGEVTVGDPIIKTIAGNGTASYLGDGSPATNAELDFPIDVFVDGSGNKYIADYLNNRVRVVNSSGIISTLVGTGASSSTGDGGYPATASVYNPAGLFKDAAGNIYITEQDGCRVREISASTGLISTIAGTGTCSTSGDGGPAVSANINHPTAITMDGAGNLYVAEWGGGRVRIINTSGVIGTFAGTGTLTGDGGPATGALLNAPYGLSYDGEGNLFISEENSYRVRQVNIGTGIITTVMGNGTSGFSGDNGPATSAQMSSLGYVYANGSNVYVADGLNQRVRMLSRSTNVISTVVGSGTLGFSGDGGPATAAATHTICGVFLDANQNIYIMDRDNERLREVSPSGGAIAAITGNGGMCMSTTDTLYNDTIGGTWTSSNTGVATILESGSTGSQEFCILNGVGIGTSTITYSVVYPCGTVYTTQVIQVTSPPGAISGNPAICLGSSTQFTDATGTGTWTSSNSSVVAIISGSGLASGLALGTSIITYSIGAGCYTTQEATVFPTPNSISPSGSVSMCVGNFFDLSDGTLGGTWSSSNNSVGTVSGIGVVTGVSAGTAMITYTTAGNCMALKTFTVAPTPNPLSPLSSTICQGGTVTYTESVTGGVWSSSNIGAASMSGAVATGVGAGSATISYSIGSCITTATVNVNPAPTSITGATTVCAGSTTNLTGNPGGGTWVSSNTTVGTISSGGTVAGIAAGTTVITYTLSSGCYLTKTVTVSSAPNAISGNKSVCTGQSTPLSDPPGGGTWSTSNVVVGTISSSGSVTGLSAGTMMITYSLGTGCIATTLFTVNANPAAISGSNNICASSSTVLTDGTGGGAWSSSNSSVASMSGGTVSGVVAGTAIISYTLSDGCFSTYPFTVNAAPSSITGTPSMCAGAQTVLNDGVSGGTWSSSNGAVASASGGTISGVSAGTAMISYTVGTGCYTTITVTVNPSPGPITGTTTMCTGATSTLSDGGGGTWTSSNTSVATINVSSGFLNAVGVGTSIISYAYTTGCETTTTVIVSSGPAGISGGPRVCAGSATMLGDGAFGGTWSSSNGAVATVGSSGQVTGVAQGTVTITYSLGIGCVATLMMTVNPAPSAINPPTGVSICPGNTASLSDPTSGGTWTSSNASVATVGSSTGTVTGVAQGTATISYTNGFGCSALKTVTVNQAPGPITPTSPLACIGSSTSLSDGVTGGTWTSNNTLIATIGSSSGSALGVASGTVIITYTYGSCYTTTTLTVSGILSAGTITGATTMCVTTPITLLDGAGGGSWISGNTSVATVGSSSGSVTGVASGTVIISYVVTNTCGSAVATHTVSVSVPGAGTILGPASVCSGTFGNYTDAVSGGVWSMANTAATVTIGGVVTGVSPGTDIITYSVSNACGTSVATKSISIGAFITAGSITGPASECIGANISLSDLAPGGSWSASNSSAVASGSIITGVSAGVDTISYTVSSSCGSAYAIHVVTVNPLPAAGAITGPASLCMGMPMNYTDPTLGGTWSVRNSSATISGTGLVTPVSTGTNIISYTVSNSCGTAVATETVSIGTAISAGSIVAATTSVCQGSTILLSDGAMGGVWSASNGNATVSGGTVTGVSAGTDVISYTVSASCGSVSATTTVTVLPLPVAGTITGPPTVCTGTTFDYTDPVSGCTWSVQNSTASILSGTLTPVAAGTNVISYTVSNTCGSAVATENITINVGAIAGTISGPTTVCTGAPAALAETATGGTWSSSSTDATVTGGTVTGVSAGTTVISYTVSNSCGIAYATYPMTIDLSPSAGAITGLSGLCLGSSFTYTDPATGGAWSMSNANATITSGGGYATPVSNGMDTISYTVSNSCGTAVATKTISINSSVSAGAITGPAGVCIGSAITLTDGAGGGAWTSSNSSVATISGGVVTGVAAGTTLISYTVTNGCGTAVATHVVTSSLVPTAGTIIGASSTCAGGFTIYTDAVSGGVWSVTNANATISSGGLLTGVVPSSLDTIVYTVTNGCGTATTSKTVSIGATLTAGTISGPGGECIGSSVTLIDGAGGGYWSSSSPLIASVGSGSGTVLGLAPGTAIISYIVSLGCGSATATYPFTVSSTPTGGLITGPSSVCAGGTITLTDLIPGGVWSDVTGNTSVSTGGIVTGLTPGIDIINYTVSDFCGIATASKTVTVSTFPTAGTISGSGTVCPGATTPLTDAVPGGVWTSENGNATVGSTGVVTGITSGTDNISYIVTNTCGSASTFLPMTIESLPDPGAISGPDSVCQGAGITLSDPTLGGVWSAGNTNATVYMGLVIGISAGADPISYTVTNSCGSSSAVLNVTIDSLPNPGVISGSTGVCIGSGIILIDTVAGGTWLASNTNATVVGPGIIDGITLGLDTIFYVVTNSCGTSVASKVLSVNPVPTVAAISGPTKECPGSYITMTDATGAGVWTSSDPGVATVGVSTGVVTGVTVGTTMITFTVTNAYGCPASATVIDTVMTAPLIPGITGSPNVCAGATTPLADLLSGGTWSSGNPLVATVDAASGLVTGVAPGTVLMSYSVVNVCGTAFVTTVETVAPLPAVSPITGVLHECQGTTGMLTDALTGGTWSSSNASIAAVGTGSGIVSGVAAGTATIMYTYTSMFGCTAQVTAFDTVLAIPVVAGITGTTNECIGAATALTDLTGSGSWSSSNPLLATVGASTGIVTGIAGGVVQISYTVTNLIGCSATAITNDTVNVSPTESPIMGVNHMCAGSSVTLDDAIPYGAWTSFNPLVASVNISTGVVTGVAAGTDKIYYSVSNSCGSARDSVVVTVYAEPSAGAISAAYTTLCSGTTVHLTDGVTGGVWGSGNPAVATVSTAGVVTGVSAGSVIISYAVTGTGGCSNEASIVLTISGAMPPAYVSPAGSETLCHGASEYMHVVTSGTGLTYQWLRNGSAISGAVANGYTTSTAGAYSVDVSNGTCSETLTGPTVTPPPTPVISFVYPNELTTGSFSTYQWYLNGVAIPGANSSTYNYAIGGNYTVVVMDANGCSDTSLAYAVSTISNTGVQTTPGTMDIKIYPNPASATVNIEAPGKVTVRLLTVDGVIISETPDAVSVDISKLAAGLYIVQVYDAEGLLVKTAKITKVE